MEEGEAGVARCLESGGFRAEAMDDEVRVARSGSGAFSNIFEKKGRSEVARPYVCGQVEVAQSDGVEKTANDDVDAMSSERPDDLELAALRVPI